MQLAIGQPFDLENTLKCGQGHRWLRSPGERWLSTVIGDDIVHIRQAGGANGPVEFHSTADEARIEPLLRRQFRLDDDIEAIYADLRRRDAKMAGLVERYSGVRVMRVDPWECLVFFILSVRKRIEHTHRDVEAIAAAFSGGTSVGDGRHSFPTPRDIAEGKPQGLRKLSALPSPLGLSKETKIYEAALAVHFRKLEFDRLAAEPSSTNAAAELMKRKGVGDKVANCVALFSLEKLDAFPVDTNIRRALRRTYADGAPASTHPPTTRKWAQARFGPYAGYASQFLFIDELSRIES